MVEPRTCARLATVPRPAATGGTTRGQTGVAAPHRQTGAGSPRLGRHAHGALQFSAPALRTLRLVSAENQRLELVTALFAGIFVQGHVSSPFPLSRAAV